MKTLLKVIVCFVAVHATSYAGLDIVRIKLEWLNAKECGFEGCKPQNVIMRPGSTMMFGWGPEPSVHDRGVFELAPRVRGEAVQLRIKRTKGSDLFAEDDRTYVVGSPEEVALKEVKLRITVTEEVADGKK